MSMTHGVALAFAGGAHIQATDFKERTALHLAADGGRVETVPGLVAGRTAAPVFLFVFSSNAVGKGR